ncbi:general secretion pathway protein GspK [Candidatus Sumerlaeota bacterium]|nr:general secretion pathway protein GspK [Candidatus Sumerlaeota bacterium]
MNDIRISNNASRLIGRARSTRKGSTLIIVLIILSILALVAATLSFTSRLETISSANFSEGLQARMAAATGIQMASLILPSNIPYTTHTQPWALQFSSLQGLYPGITDSLADLQIEDESAKLNINAADEVFMIRALASILESNNMDPSPATQLAKEIAIYRLGPDQKPGVAGKDDDGDSAFSSLLNDGVDNDRDGIVDNPEEILIDIKYDGKDNNQKGMKDTELDGLEFDLLDNDHDGVIDEKEEGVDEPDEFISDPSQTPNGDDTPFLSVDELKFLPSMTPEIFEAIRPFLTAYSASEPVCSIEGFSVVRVDINAASPQEILDMLQRRFPDKDDNLLKQFAVNIVDARDADSIPTQLQGSSPDTPFLGIEKTPYINEVWPDSITENENGDDGQYIELFNPWDEPLCVQGWRVEVAGASVILDGSVNPCGFLVITDDYDSQNDLESEDNEKGYGSFYDIFNLVKGGNSKRIVEKREMEIPNDSAVISLRDSEGNLIDYFAYSAGNFAGVKRSFQRTDPRVRCAVWEFCSPLQNNFSYSKTESDGVRSAPFVMRDRLFESPLDLMDVFAGYSNTLVSDKNAQPVKTSVTWSTPFIQSGEKSALDLHILDLFRVSSQTGFSPSEIVKTLGSVDEDDLYRLKNRQERIERTFGLVNINTAPAHVLQAIPGFDKNLVRRVAHYRNKVERAAQTGDDAQTPSAPFKNFSDLIDLLLDSSHEDAGLNGKSDSEILATLRQMSPYIAVQSRSFTIYSENRFHFPTKLEGGSSREARHPARSVIKAIVLVSSPQAIRIIDWAYLAR